MRYERGMPASSAPSQPELTPRSTIIGLVLSVVMGAANVYLGLKAGMTVSASIPAAVVGTLILRGLFRRATILEANQIQTAASAGESLAAGIIFTMPALLLIGVWQRFDMLVTTAIAFAGGLLGVLIMIPMRRVFVVENKQLPYPEGVACAAVLKAANREEATDELSVTSVIAGVLLGALSKLSISFFGVFKGTLEAASLAAGRILFVGADISPALVAVGFIVRLNVALLIFAGGALAWLVLIPCLPELNEGLSLLSPSLAYHGSLSGGPIEQAWGLWSSAIRYVGVGAMLVGGIASIVRVRGGLVAAARQLRLQLSTRTLPSEIERTERDLSPSAILLLTLVAVSVIAAVYYQFTGGLGITMITTVIMLVMSFFFVAVASYIVGLVGNSNSPVSGMTITAVLFTGAFLWICDYSGTEGMVATLGVAAIVCCAACTAGDVCNDLKTGHLVGATPRSQQIMQIAGIAIASLVMGPVLQLLHNAYTIGSRELSAPQAGLFASLARGLFGDGDLPWGMIAVGALIGGTVLLVDALLARRKSAFRLHLMPLAVGIYLPFGLSLPILAGGVIAHVHRSGAPVAEANSNTDRGILFSSGVIAGESLIGIVIAVLVSMGISGLNPPIPLQGPLTAGAALLALWYFVRQTGPKASPR